MTEDKTVTAISRQRPSTLSDLDWRIVETARADRRHSLDPNSVWAVLARKLFGITLARPLANEGLEALRRFSVRAWHWNIVRPSELGALIDAGYSRTDALQILAHIAAHRGCMPSIQDDLLEISSEPGGGFAHSRRRLGSVAALSAPQASSLAPGRGQGLWHQGWQPCPCR